MQLRPRQAPLAQRPVVPADVAPISLNRLLQRVYAVGLKVNKHRNFVWVDIADLRDTNRHIYLTLAQHRCDGSLVAQANGIIWQLRRHALLGRFREKVGVDLKAGMKILAEVRYRADLRKGFALEIVDILPVHGVSSITSRLTRIRQQLEDEGLWDRNRRLPAPDSVQRVAVITPAGSAAFGDFQRPLQRLQGRGAVTIEPIVAQFQGEGAPASFRSAFAQVDVLRAHASLALVAILRGGGTVPDLNWLNDYAIARCVTDCPIPVWTGIGHVRDHTILDDVAQRSLGTPSKAGQEVRSAAVRRRHSDASDP